MFLRQASGRRSFGRHAMACALIAALTPVFPAGAFAADDIPGTPLTASPAAGSTTTADPRDVYSVTLEADQVLELTLTGTGSADYDMYLWDPDATTIENYGETPPIAASDLVGTSSESISYLVPPGGGGTYYVEVYDFDLVGGSYQLTWSKTTPDVARLAGLDRYATSLAISRSSFTQSDSVVVATGSNYPDALAASGLAGLLDCPVILIRGNALDAGDFDDLLFEMHRLGCIDAYVIGGIGVISTEVADAIDSAGYTVKRLAGDDRYGTARAVADEMVELGADPGSAFVVSGANFADALAVSPYAFSRQIPILLTRPDALPDTMREFITANSVNDVVVAGGTGAVSAGVASTLDGLNGGAVSVYRAGGADRYATAALVARHCIDTRGWGSWQYVGIATGALFPDALSGGAAVGTRGGALLLTQPGALVEATRSAIDDNSTTVKLSLVFGGTGAVSDAVKSAVAAAMQ